MFTIYIVMPIICAKNRREMAHPQWQLPCAFHSAHELEPFHLNMHKIVCDRCMDRQVYRNTKYTHTTYIRIMLFLLYRTGNWCNYWATYHHIFCDSSVQHFHTELHCQCAWYHTCSKDISLESALWWTGDERIIKWRQNLDHWYEHQCSNK